MEQSSCLPDSLQAWPIEWWYWSGHVTSLASDAAEHRDYSFMLALFKIKPFGIGPIWFTHSLVSCIETGEFEPSIDFFLTGFDKGSFPKGELKVKAGKKLAIDKIGERGYVLKTPRFELELAALKPAMPVGGSGLIDLKSSKTWYYSYPRLQVAGRLRVSEVDDWKAIKGSAWMDHQCSPVSFNNEHVWKWFSFQLGDGTDLMCFSYGRKKEAVLATMSLPDGSIKATADCRLIPGKAAWTSPVTGAKYPVEWTFEIPGWDVELRARAKIEEQEMLFGLMNYWEGPLKTEGYIGKAPVKGDGFMELVGYPKKRLTKMLRLQLAQLLK